MGLILLYVTRCELIALFSLLLLGRALIKGFKYGDVRYLPTHVLWMPGFPCILNLIANIPGGKEDEKKNTNERHNCDNVTLPTLTLD